MTYSAPMRAPLLLAALAFAPGLLAAPPSSTPGSTPLVPAPVGTDANISLSLSTLTVSAS